jgi:DNA-binding SARP family transcriptional activator
MHELFQRLPQAIQTFLIGTSILEFLSVELCDSVLGVGDAHDAHGFGGGYDARDARDGSGGYDTRGALDYLERENLFIHRVGQSERLYRYHNMFKEFLMGMHGKENDRGGHEKSGPSDGEKVKVACFGRFQVRLPGAADDARWRTKKAQELFAYLFHLQGQPVEKETILLQLWPDLDHESATSLLHTTLYSIRKMLAACQSENLIVYCNKKYAMRMEMVSSALCTLDRLCHAAGAHDGELVYNSRDVLASCRGEYLGGIACSFAAAPRAYYEQKFLQLSYIAAGQCMDRMQWEEAVELLDMGIEADPFDEGQYGLILRCFHEMRDLRRAKRYYAQLRDLLREELGVEPSDEVEAAYRLCVGAGAGKRRMFTEVGAACGA